MVGHRWHAVSKAPTALTTTAARQQPAMAESLIGAYKPPAAIPLAEAAAWTALARTVLNLDEFITRE